MDPYATLGVSPQSSAKDIKAAYRKKAFECHPDKFATASHEAQAAAAEAFRDLTEAYQILTRGRISRAPSSSSSPQRAWPSGDYARHGPFKTGSTTFAALHAMLMRMGPRDWIIVSSLAGATLAAYVAAAPYLDQALPRPQQEATVASSAFLEKQRRELERIRAARAQLVDEKKAPTDVPR